MTKEKRERLIHEMKKFLIENREEMALAAKMQLAINEHRKEAFIKQLEEDCKIVTK